MWQTDRMHLLTSRAEATLVALAHADIHDIVVNKLSSRLFDLRLRHGAGLGRVNEVACL